MSIITFGGTPEIILPLSDVRELGMRPILRAGGVTSLGPAIALLRRELGSDIAELKQAGFRIYRPAAFLITDGIAEPDDTWRVEYQALTQERYHPTIIAFGIGQPDPRTISGLASRNDLAFIAANDVSSVKAIDSFGATITNFFASFTSSHQQGDAQLTIPQPSDFHMVPDTSI